jgi:hypothetical protein
MDHICLLGWKWRKAQWNNRRRNRVAQFASFRWDQSIVYQGICRKHFALTTCSRKLHASIALFHGSRKFCSVQQWIQYFWDNSCFTEELWYAIRARSNAEKWTRPRSVLLLRSKDVYITQQQESLGSCGFLSNVWKWYSDSCLNYLCLLCNFMPRVDMATALTTRPVTRDTEWMPEHRHQRSMFSPFHIHLPCRSKHYVPFTRSFTCLPRQARYIPSARADTVERNYHENQRVLLWS